MSMNIDEKNAFIKAFATTNCMDCDIKFQPEGERARHIAENGKILCGPCRAKFDLNFLRELLADAMEDEE